MLDSDVLRTSRTGHYNHILALFHDFAQRVSGRLGTNCFSYWRHQNQSMTSVDHYELLLLPATTLSIE